MSSIIRDLFYTYNTPLGLETYSFCFTKDLEWLFPHLIYLYMKRSGISPPKPKVETWESFGDRCLCIQRKQLSESEKSKADLSQWLMLLSRLCSHNYFSHSSHSTLKDETRFFEKDKNSHNEKRGNSAELLICFYLNTDKHLDQAAVSSAGKCTGEKKVWNCIWDTPALSRSAGLWKSSLFS